MTKPIFSPRTRSVTTYVKVEGFTNASHVCVSVYFSAGGMNYSNYKMEPRGIYTRWQPMLVSEDALGRTEQYQPFAGGNGKVFVAPVPGRYSAPTLKRFAAAIIPLAGTIASLVSTPNAIVEAVRAASDGIVVARVKGMVAAAKMSQAIIAAREQATLEGEDS
jgi:hypothetical protein